MQIDRHELTPDALTDVPVQSAGRKLAMSGNGKIASFTLCASKALLTDGDSSYDDIQVGPVLSGIPLYVEDMVVQALCESRTAGFKYKIKGQWSFDGKTWEDYDSDLLGEQSVSGAVNGSAYTTRTDFGRYVRFLVSVNDAGAVEQGVLSVIVVLKFWT